MSDKDINRRNVLRMIGSSAAIAGGLGIGSAAGKQGEERNGRRKDLEKKYRNERRVRRVVRYEAQEVLEELAERGIIGKPSIDIFDFDDESLDVNAVTTKDDVQTAHIRLSKTNAEYNLTLHVQPEAGKSYALVKSKDTGEEFAIMPSTEPTKLESAEKSEGEVTMQSSCNDYWYCTGNVCLQQGGHAQPIQCYKQKIKYDCYLNPQTNDCICVEERETCDGPNATHCGTYC